MSKEKGFPNFQVPDRNDQVRAGQLDLDHQGCHPKRKLYKKSCEQLSSEQKLLS